MATSSVLDFQVQSGTSLELEETERTKNAVDLNFSSSFLSQFTCRYRNVGEKLQDPLLTERYCKKYYIKYCIY